MPMRERGRARTARRRARGPWPPGERDEADQWCEAPGVWPGRQQRAAGRAGDDGPAARLGRVHASGLRPAHEADGRERRGHHGRAGAVARARTEHQRRIHGSEGRERGRARRAQRPPDEQGRQHQREAAERGRESRQEHVRPGEGEQGRLRGRQERVGHALRDHFALRRRARRPPRVRRLLRTQGRLGPCAHAQDRRQHERDRDEAPLVTHRAHSRERRRYSRTSPCSNATSSASRRRRSAASSIA